MDGPVEANGGIVVPRQPSTFESLHYREYRRLWIAGLFVFMGVNGQGIARGWLARELTGTNAGLGGVLLAFGVAMLVSTPFGGVIADRLPKRIVLVIAQLLLMVSSVWIGVAIQFDFVEYWMLLAASALQALGFAMFGPARMAFVADLVPGPVLPNAIILGQMGAEGMRVVGPTIAGIVIAAAVWGLQVVFLVSGALFVLGSVLTIILPERRRPASASELTPWGQMREGLRYVRNRPDLTLLVVTSLVVVMVGYPYMAFLPSVADGIFDEGSSGYGVLSAASAAGAVVAGFLVARTRSYDPWRFVVIAGFGFGIGLVLLGLMPLFELALVMVAVTGAMSLMFQTMTNSLLLSLSDFDYHGRIQSLVMLGFSAFGIAALPLGALADLIGLRPTLIGMGIIVIAALVVFNVRRQRFRGLEIALDFG